jgi:hypothetical protein
MQEVLCWNRMEGIFKRVPAPYTILSLIFGVLVLVIFLIFIFEFEIEMEEGESIANLLLRILFSSFLISYLLLGNQYMLDNMRSIFQNMKFIPGEEHYAGDIYNDLRHNFISSKKFYIFVLFVFIPSIIIDNRKIKDILSNTNLDSITEMDFTLFYNIYDYIIYFLFIYLIVNILWIIFNSSSMLNRIASNPVKHLIKIDLFNADKIGGLGRIRVFIIKLIIYYSIGISLALLCYIRPGQIYNIIFLLLLLLAGVMILVAGLESLQRLFRGRMEEELENINKKYQDQYEKLTRNISDNYPPKEDDLQSAMKLIDVLHNERKEREQILNENKKTYSYTAIFVALISIILPLFTLFEKMNNYGLVDTLLKAFNITK